MLSAAGRLSSIVRGAHLGALLSVVLCSGGCRKSVEGPLSAPSSARSWESRFAVAFDDSFTPTPIRMGGRAPNDVLDQRLFAARIGHADLVVEVTVQQVWGRGRYAGKPEQYLDVVLGEVLLGELPDDTAGEQLLVLRQADPVSADLEGERLVMFARWAPQDDPSFRHHLMPRTPELVEQIDAMVAHAEENGIKLDARSSKRKRRKRRKDRD